MLPLQITKSDIRPQVQWTVSLVIADGHFNLPQLVWVCMAYILTLSPLRDKELKTSILLIKWLIITGLTMHL